MHSKLLSLLLFMACCALPAFAGYPFQWKINPADPADKDWHYKRGDLDDLRPVFPADISGCQVVMAYCPVGGLNTYAQTGSVFDGTNGVACVPLTSSLFPTNPVWSYVVYVSGPGVGMSASGRIIVHNTLIDDGSTNPAPVVYSVIDCGTVIWENAGSAPFAFSNAVEVLVANEAAQRAAGDSNLFVRINAYSNALAAATTSEAGARAAGDSNVVTRMNAYSNALAAAIAEEAGQRASGESNLVADIGQNLGGDLSGSRTDATVYAIQHIPILPFTVGTNTDHYGIVYDASSNAFLLAPVAAIGGGGGTSISNILMLSGTGNPLSVGSTNIAVYRIIRPGNLPSAVVNVGGYECFYIDLSGATIGSGSLNGLTAPINCDVRANDGSTVSPSYSWAGEPGRGEKRMSFSGDYAVGHVAHSNVVWTDANDGIHLGTNSRIFGMNATSFGCTNTFATNRPYLRSVDGTNLYWSASP